MAGLEKIKSQILDEAKETANAKIEDAKAQAEQQKQAEEAAKKAQEQQKQALTCGDGAFIRDEANITLVADTPLRALLIDLPV